MPSEPFFVDQVMDKGGLIPNIFATVVSILVIEKTIVRFTILLLFDNMHRVSIDISANKHTARCFGLARSLLLLPP